MRTQHIIPYSVLRWRVRCFSEWQGKPIDFVGVDESTARWVQDFNVKPYATPAKLESIDGENINFKATWRFLFQLLLLLLVGLCSVMSWQPFPGARYQALLIPDCPGAPNDLAHSGSLHRILTHFISHQSECEADFKSSQCVISFFAVEIWMQVVSFLFVQSPFVQWDKECRLCVVPLRDRGGSSMAIV